MSETILILHNIRSTHNVGSIFRTADGAGVSKVFLIGYTPAPVDRFGREQKDIAKTALGAQESVPWEQREGIHELLVELKNCSYNVATVEQAKNSIVLADFTPLDKQVYILGNEIEGVPQDILEASDRVVEIPMLGEKESLNVAVAAGVVLFNAKISK